jgi:hypothetical protein
MKRLIAALVLCLFFTPVSAQVQSQFGQDASGSPRNVYVLDPVTGNWVAMGSFTTPGDVWSPSFGVVSSVGNYAADSTLTITGTGAGPWTGAVTIKCTVGTTSQIGCLEPDGTIITDTAGVITVPKATSGAFGVVEPDGTIITVTGGAITVSQATTGAFGVVKVGTNLGVTGGVISVATATSAALGVSSPDNVTIKAAAGVYADQYPTSGDLMLSAGNGAVPTAYAGASCTNQAVTAINVAGAVTCANITNSFLTAGAFTSITGVGVLTAGTASTGFVIGGATMTLGSDATGDIYYRNSLGVLTRLPIGGSGNTLVVSGGLPSWSATAGSGTVTSVGTSGLATGGPITTTGTVTVTAAAKSDEQTGTSATLATTPSQQQQHDSALKAHGAWTISGGTVTALSNNYNVTLSRASAGTFTASFTTNFASANYDCVASVSWVSGSFTTSGTQVDITPSTRVAASIGISTFTSAGSNADPSELHLQCAGRQ